MPGTSRKPLIALLAGIIAAPALAAQAPLVSLRGIAWDSLRSEPLPGAFISVAGTGRTGAADSRGRFQIDSVPPGSYTILLSHDALDSLGLTGVSGKFDVTDGRAEIRLSVPSFASFWKTGCTGRAPRDSSLVYGVVRRAGRSGVPVANAKVELAWLDVNVRGKRDLQQTMQKLETTTDAAGNYGFCGVPNGAGFRVRASADEAASGIIDMAPNPNRVRWRDLSVGPLPGTDPIAVGVVSGQIMRSGNVPFPDARIIIDDAGETRTDSTGHFTLPRVPTGTRQIQVQAVGLEPVLQTVDVAQADTARVHLNLDRVTRLGSVRVTGLPFTNRLISSIGERRAQGLGYFTDSTAFVGMSPWIKSALQSIPHLFVRDTVSRTGISGTRPAQYLRMRAGCIPTLFIDGVDQRGHERLWTLNTDEIGVLEMYPSRAVLPLEFQSNLRGNCALVVWTKAALSRR